MKKMMIMKLFQSTSFAFIVGLALILSSCGKKEPETIEQTDKQATTNTQIAVDPQISAEVEKHLDSIRTGSREEVAKSLIKMGKEAVPALIQALRLRPDDGWLICEVLGEIRDERAIDALIEAYQDDTFPSRSSAAIALGKFKKETILDMFISDLGNIPSDGPSPPVEGIISYGKGAIDALIDVIERGEGRARYEAISALGGIPDSRSVKQLMRVLQNDADDVNRVEAAVGLGQLADAKSLDALINAIKDPSFDVRLAALEALSHFTDKKAYQALLNTLTHKDPALRATAAIALAEFGNKDAISHLEKLLADSDEDVRIAAQESIDILKESN
jgi:HEAT repeat protein